MPEQNVLPRGTLLTETLLKTLVSSAVRKVQLSHDLTDKDLAERIACDPGTIANARNRENKLQAQTLFNLMAVDQLAIEGLLHHFGRRSVPIEARCDTDALVSTSAAVHRIAEVQSSRSEGKRQITDNECIRIEPELDDAIEALSALKSRCEAIRAARAA